ncbi:uncharacterized protein EDB91DRAFT_1353082, partial [Suillus paluster]|uniref:uncharacterized protein n=1 Tax=Suillus paluster TaxID=48578 RepID=UPI001B86CF79
MTYVLAFMGRPRSDIGSRRVFRRSTESPWTRMETEYRISYIHPCRGPATVFRHGHVLRRNYKSFSCGPSGLVTLAILTQNERTHCHTPRSLPRAYRGDGQRFL